MIIWAAIPPSVPKPNEVVRRSQSFCLGSSSHKKGFPLKSGCIRFHV